MALHYGIFLEPSEPTTGVYSGNDIAWEFVDTGDWIDLELEEAIQSGDITEDELDLGYWEPGDTQLYGDWIQENDGRYAPDPAGEFAMIYNRNYNTVQVVHSSRVLYGRLASPCYPGQVDSRLDDTELPDSIHVQAFYALPAWALYQD